MFFVVYCHIQIGQSLKPLNGDCPRHQGGHRGQIAGCCGAFFSLHTSVPEAFAADGLQGQFMLCLS